MKTNIINNAKGIILGLALVLGVGYVYAAGTWTAPGCEPPNCNVDAPINVGGLPQTKTAKITATDLEANNTLTTKDLIVKTTILPTVIGQALVAADTTGKVKWGSALGGCEIQHGRKTGFKRDAKQQITFPKPFSSTPNVTVTADASETGITTAFAYLAQPDDKSSAVTSSGFWVAAQQDTAIQWIAIAGTCF